MMNKIISYLKVKNFLIVELLAILILTISMLSITFVMSNRNVNKLKDISVKVDSIRSNQYLVSNQIIKYRLYSDEITHSMLMDDIDSASILLKNMNKEINLIGYETGINTLDFMILKNSNINEYKINHLFFDKRVLSDSVRIAVKEKWGGFVKTSDSIDNILYSKILLNKNNGDIIISDLRTNYMNSLIRINRLDHILLIYMLFLLLVICRLMFNDIKKVRREKNMYREATTNLVSLIKS